ncbi:hypothetical protein SH611_18470 [Geminicoccaceae bacterium 1502E]|nr:hypothetical protein [Geminicoccaceae bacterium 1502E]
MKPMSHLDLLSGQPEAARTDNHHTINFPDPHQNRVGAFRVWLSAGGGLLVSVDNPREARLVLKTVMALSGGLDARSAGLQQCAADGQWAEWADAGGRGIHELDDEDLLFMPPSQEPRSWH